MTFLIAISLAWQLAKRSLLINKMRTFLTMLGIIIGISSVILMISLGKGAESLILSQVSSSYGAQTVFIQSGRGDEHQDSGLAKQSLTTNDIKKLKRLDSLDLVGGVLFFSERLVYEDMDKKVQVVGAMAEEPEIDDAFPIVGRFIDDAEANGGGYVAVLGYKLAKDIFGQLSEALEKDIKIRGKSFRVVGVMEEQGTKFFTNFDENVYIPLKTAQDLFGVDYVVYIAARAVVPVEIAKEDIRLALRESHNIDNPNGDLGKDDFFVSTPADAAEIVNTVGMILTLLLTSIAAISLLVGGIGIMNIMLVTVTERTREIGLRMAVGARRKDIMQQFLIESIILTIGGGILGIIFGLLLSSLGAAVLAKLVSGWRLVVSVPSIILGLGVSMAVGLLFGLYPARRAAKLNPIEALRYE